MLRVAGAGLLIAAGEIHLDLYLTGYRTIPVIGWLFLLQVIAAFGLGPAVLATGGRPVIASRLAAAGAAGFALATLGGYLLSVWTGLFGFTEVRTTAGIIAGVIEVVAFAVVALAIAPARTDATARAPDGTAATLVRFPARISPPITRTAATTAAALAVAALVLLGVAVAGAGPPASATTGTGTGLKTTVIGGAAVLTNANGFTLCSFAPDTPATSKCPGSCAAYWPPVTPVPPRPARPAGPGRRDHPDRWLPPAHLQRHPLYTYIGDTAPGQAKGNNLNLNGGLSPGRGYARPGRPVIGRLAP